MKTKIFCDSADLSIIKKLNNNSLVDGFTTNPSLMNSTGAKNYKNYALKLLKVCKKKPISLEVFGDTYKEMLRQALIINTWGKQKRWLLRQYYFDLFLGLKSNKELFIFGDGKKQFGLISIKGMPVTLCILAYPVNKS